MPATKKRPIILSSRDVFSTVGKQIHDSTPDKKRKTPNPFYRHCDKISLSDSVDTGLSIVKNRDGKQIVRLALISLPIPVTCEWKYKNILSDSSSWPDIDSDACRRWLLGQSHDHAKKFFITYENALQSAVDQKADIICINEFAFPAGNLRPLPQARSMIRKLVQQHQILVIAGSSHDHRTMYNTAHIYYPHCARYGVQYHKQVSATEEREFASVPSQRKSIVFKAFGLNINVILCLDLLDYSAVASIVRLQEGIDFLFVPACSEWTDDLRKSAIVASEAMPGYVAIVNHYVKGEFPIFLQLFGKKNPIEPSLPSVRLSASDGGQINFYDIDVDWFREKKSGLQYKCHDDLVWLFGIDRPRSRQAIETPKPPISTKLRKTKSAPSAINTPPA